MQTPFNALFNLGRLANKLQPGTVKKINKMKMPFMMVSSLNEETEKEEKGRLNRALKNSV